ncbi:hypothetical protein JCM14036_19720 [Desulfotomaculum defluvii]
MNNVSYLKTQETSDTEIDNLLNIINSIQVSENIFEILDIDKIIRAGKLCAAYPHLNTNIVKHSLILMELINNGLVSSDANSILETMVNMGMEEKLKVLKVLVEARTDYASGEAKVVQYFCH